MAKEKLNDALFWQKERNGVRCELCSWRCFIPKGKLGECGVRKNIDNSLYSLNYGKITSFGPKPVESIPMFHFYPNSKTFFIGTVGSSFKFDFKEDGGKEKEVGIKKMYSEIEKSKTYSATFGGGDPVVDMEYVLELMKMNKKRGIANVLVTNGYLTNETNKKIDKFLDGIVLESYASLQKDFYKEHCGIEDTAPIRVFLKQMKKHRIHIEVSNVIVPQIGEDLESFRRFTDFVTAIIDSYTPIHIVPFKPAGKLTHVPKTSTALLEKFWETAKEEGMRNVFAHGISGREDTICYNCNHTLITRKNGVVQKIDMQKDRCSSCGLKINMVIK